MSFSDAYEIHPEPQETVSKNETTKERKPGRMKYGIRKNCRVGKEAR